MIEVFTPEYADKSITTEERANRLVDVSKVISYWESRMPPVQFNLKLNEESTLTMEERLMRLGVTSTIGFDLDGVENNGGRRGKLERFIVEGINDDDDDVEEEVGGDDGSDGVNDADSDGTVEEVVAATDDPSRRLAATNNVPKKNKKQGHRRMQDNPPAVYWHASGYTTIVKNQGYCGCCWAVSTTAAIESALMITNKTNRVDAMTKNSLSFQQMISCDDKNLACDGGNIVSLLLCAPLFDCFSSALLLLL